MSKDLRRLLFHSVDIDIQSIIVYNNVGQGLKEKTIGSNFYRLNTSNYENGIYFLKLKTEEGMIFKKLIT